MKLTAFVGKGLLTAGVATAGLSTGNWAHDTVHRPATPTAQASTIPQFEADGIVPATTDSLLHYQFIAGERTYYRLQADISGAGIESLAGSGGVAMTFAGAMQVFTESVDEEGNGALDIRFDQVQMQGSFMDEPVSLSHSVAGTEYHYGNENVSSAAGDKVAGIPQLEFFNTPTKATVSPSGEVLRVSGAPGMDQMLSPETLVASVQFPTGDLDPGTQWTSEFGMPVPGVGEMVSSQAVNTLEGFDLFRGRYCAIIRQTLNAKQEDGQINSPQSALGEEMNFSMPAFNLSGENRIYFDVENGQLVQADLNLEFSMRIGDELKAVAETLDVYGKLLNELEGNKPGEKPQEDLLNLGLKIAGSLSIVD
jgi:hypothetical protein